jgi:hypothetical protein
VQSGTATLIKKDIFRNLMWYVLPNSTKQYPLSIERVRKIRSLNNQNIIPDELEAVEVVSTKPKEVEPEFVDVVGHISLRSLEKADKKRQQRGREQRGNRQQATGNLPAGQQGKQLQKGPQQQKPMDQRPPQQQQKSQQRPPGQQQKGQNQQRPPQQRRPPQNPNQKKG